MPGSSIGTAYVQIVPAATGISGKIEQAIAPGATSAGVVAGKNISQSIGSTLQKVGGGMMKAGAIATAVSVPIVMGIKKALDAYKIQNAAETKLTEIYKTRMGVTEDAAKATMEYASALQQQGVVGDEVLLSGAQQLATFAKTPDAVNKLLPAMGNLLVQQKGLNGTQEDATNIANLMGKVMNGQVGALKRVGITFDENQEKILKNGNEEERAAMLAQVITDNVGNMNEAMLNTPEGKMQQLANSFGDMKEQLGKAIVPVLADIAGFIQEKIMPAVSGFFKMLQDNPVIARIVVAVAGILAIGGPLLIMLGMIVSSVGALIPMVTAISAPVLAVVGVIAAVVAALAVAYNKNEEFRAAVNQLVSSVFNAVKGLISVVVPVIKAIIKIIVQLIVNIAGSLVPVIQKLTPIITKVINMITALVKKAAPIILTVLRNVASVISTVVSIAAKLFTGLLTKLTGIWTKITSVISKAVEFIKTHVNFGAMADKVKATFTKIKDFIANPIEKARDLVKKAIDAIKKIFPLKLGKIFSGIKLPHFEISGGKIPWGVGGLGEKPTVNVKWYAKGGIFDNPSVIGVGEAGREAVVPLQGRNMRPFAEAIATELNGAGNTYNIGDIKLSLDDLKEIVTLEQFIEVVKRAKAFA